MDRITREQLAAYLDDALSDIQTAQVEQALRTSDPLRKLLRSVMQEQDRGEHSVGGIWRRRRLSCPSRETLGNHLLGVLDADEEEYLAFHLQTIGCSFCQANLADPSAQQQEAGSQVHKRRRRYFESSAGLLEKNRRG